nr:hypothetical protein [Treponemataceae bacterium]
LRAEKIAEMGKEIPLPKLKEQVSQRLSQYTDYFTAERIAAINNLYRQIVSFRDICTYDYFFLLKKFNKSLREKDFSTVPQFDKINAEYILDDLKDFVSIAWAIPFESDWTPLMKLLHAYKGVEPVAPAVWKKVLARISALRLSGSFEMMLRLISANPKYVQEVPILKADIVEPHLEKLRKESEDIVQKLISQEQTNKANDICAQLFGAAEVQQLRNYVPSKNAVLAQKNLKTFAYALPLNYCKAFLLEIVKKDMREYYDIVIVRGKWESQTLSAPFSESYNALLTLSDTISSFDEQLEDDKPIGMKMKTLMLKADRDNGSRNTINRLVGDANDSAYASIMDVTKNLIEMGKIIKSLVDDCTKSKPILVTNWKELEHYTDIPMHDFSVMIYKKIYLFTTLIKTTLEQ